MQEKIDTFFKRNPGVCEDVARSEEDRDEEGGKGRHEAGRQEEQSEREVREDKDDDEMVERGAENSDVAVTRHQFREHQPLIDMRKKIIEKCSVYLSLQRRKH
ncbi:hypothetical protein G5714_002847 [Onychostoma macrolepis]|uniref:Uncharacterized protein n=1 Tax=Onychostoma macrolepis TaxID=369639 RepID=A0A7J6D7T4_9TELE|nr:hypothetical protein G5714_002847 [Onychostoma macrolepis]